MNTRRTTLAALAAAALAASVAVPAIAQDSTVSLSIVGGVSVKPGDYIKDTQRFQAKTLAVASGNTVKLTNKAKTKDPHTISFVKPTEVPKTTAKVNGCFEGGVCGKLGQAHEFPEGDGPPGKPIVDVGAEGVDQAGDSLVLMKKTLSFKVTAKAGSTLNYLCAVHPWMQGKITVR